MESIRRDIGAAISHARSREDISIECLAKYCNISVNRLKRIERGEINVRNAVLKRICTKLEISFSELMESTSFDKYYDIYYKIKPLLSEKCRSILDNNISHTRFETKNTNGTISLGMVRYLGMVVRIPMQISSKDISSSTLPVQRGIEELANYLNILADEDYLIGGKLGMIKMHLPRTMPDRRVMIMAYVGIIPGIENEDINNLLGVKLAGDEGELPNEL